MENAAQLAQAPTPNLEYGRVVAGKKDQVMVHTTFGTVEAQRAVSCLVKPIAGDRVLLSTDLAGSCFILSVLERTVQGEETELALEGDTALSVVNGNLRLSSEGSLLASGAESIEMAADKVSLNAHEGEANIGKLTFMGSTLYSQVKRFVAVAKTVEHTFKRFTQRFENCERFVEDHEEVQTGSTRYLVEDTMTTHAKNTMNVSEELHTMQAEQIHMG